MVPPALDSLMPPVSGLLQPTLIRLALEKLVPARGPAENINGFSGDSGSTVAAPHSSRVFAIRCRPRLMISSPAITRRSTRCSSRWISKWVRCGDCSNGVLPIWSISGWGHFIINCALMRSVLTTLLKTLAARYCRRAKHSFRA